MMYFFYMTESLKSAFQTIPLKRDSFSGLFIISERRCFLLTDGLTKHVFWTRRLRCNNVQHLCCHGAQSLGLLPATTSCFLLWHFRIWEGGGDTEASNSQSEDPTHSQWVTNLSCQRFFSTTSNFKSAIKWNMDRSSKRGLRSDPVPTWF